MDILNSIIRSDGVDLSGFGINGYAFKADAALKAVEVLRGASVKILGGDVLKATVDRYELTYDNWCYEEFDVNRSCDEAKDYITNYRDRNGDEFVYQLVILAESEGKDPETC